MSMDMITSKEKFFEVIYDISKIELAIKGHIESKLYGYVRDKQGGTHLTSTELPEKDFDDMKNIFENIAETAMRIGGFRKSMLESNYKTIALAHIEVFKNSGEDKKTIIIFLDIDVDEKNNAIILKKMQMEISGGEQYVDEEGDFFTTKLKLIPTNIEL